MNQRKVTTIRQLYEHATPVTVEHDLRAAVEILKTFPDEESRAHAAVYMDGLSQLRSEWQLEKHSAERKRNKSRLGAHSPRPPRTTRR